MLAITTKSLNTATHAPSIIRMRCPKCRHLGSFEAFGNQDALIEARYRIGMRRCPQHACQTVVFIIADSKTDALLESYPPELLDFDSTNVPPRVTAALEEALKCHAASCFVASAIMVRKTLEELCKDRGATGNNLAARIRALGSKIILPPELLTGLDDLRLLGNDAAHIESNTYDAVGKDEVDLAIEVAKEVLKAVYQYQSLIDKLRALKKTP